MRPLEAGAGGVMAAMVRNVRQVEDLLGWAKFHPRGMRGVNGTGVDGHYGMMPAAEYYRRANAESFVGVQIEHIDAVEDIEKIAAVPDLDFLFIGPADLSQSMGLPGEWDHPHVAGHRARRPASRAIAYPGRSCRATPPTLAAASSWVAGSCPSASTPGSSTWG